MEKFVVVSMVDGELWYYGLYDTATRANEVVNMLGKEDHGFLGASQAAALKVQNLPVDLR